MWQPEYMRGDSLREASRKLYDLGGRQRYDAQYVEDFEKLRSRGGTHVNATRARRLIKTRTFSSL